MTLGVLQLLCDQTKTDEKFRSDSNFDNLYQVLSHSFLNISFNESGTNVKL